MWTKTTRWQYRRDGLRFASDTTDDEWALLEPLMPEPIVLVLCVVGAYALSNSMNGVYVLALFCVIGYAMVKARIPLAPLILGVVLGDQIEANLIQSISTNADPWLFLTRPISGGLLLASAASIVFAVWQHRRESQKLAAAEEEFDTDF